MGSAPQMLGVWGKEKKNTTRQAGGQTTGAVFPDMIAPEANLSGGDKRPLQHAKAQGCLRARSI